MGFKTAKNTRNVNQGDENYEDEFYVLFEGLQKVLENLYSSGEESNGNYEVNDLIFPTKKVCKMIKSINRKLKLLYSPAPPNSLWPTINYSTVRDDKKEFDALLDRVEKRIDRFKEKVKIIETDDSAFQKEFCGIRDFLYEASNFEDNKEDELSKQTEEYMKKRFISIADKFWKAGVHPSEF